ncbi:MAG: hypothetical protein DMG09_28385, partial [Acidobacteria bacterium]
MQLTLGGRVPLLQRNSRRERPPFALRQNLILQERPAKGAVFAKLCSLEAQRFSVEKHFAHCAQQRGGNAIDNISFEMGDSI